MKKSLIAALIAAAVVLTGCKTTEVAGSKIKGNKVKVSSSTKRTMVNYQGSTFGRPIPEWVLQVADGQYDASYLKKYMPSMEGKKAFVCVGRGDNLDFVQQWTDLVDIEVSVGDTIQRVVGKKVEATMKGSQNGVGNAYNQTEVDKALSMTKEAMSCVELNGLEKNAAYWVEIEAYNRKTKKTQNYFEYYTVWTMSEKNYETQIKQALKGIDDNTAQSKALQEAIMGSLLGDRIPVVSNNPEVVEAADDMIVYAE